MDRRSWPWKRKSSDKAAVEKAAAILDSAAATLASDGDQDKYKKPNYVQISVESYSHLTSLENEVKNYVEKVQTLEDEIKDLNEKLNEAESEMSNKDTLVKQHAKVAEEAVSGWEKAEAEALALKGHLETVTLSKLAAEDRASHLDGALKECMRQIRNLKEEHEKTLQEVVLSKTKQWEKIKDELEANIASLDQELMRSAAENDALARSLQERSNMLIKVNEEKSQAEAEIEHLKGNIESCEREINALKYELHVASKELEIRNEEKNMSVKSAEVANKQHMEGVKKIAKLEAECQRLRGLVRKKLPGPAALAQMKMEVESLGREYGESRLRRSPGKPPSLHLSPLPDYALDNLQKFQKENEFLAERLLAMEEETKMLKEALAKRNSELQVSRNLYAKNASKLQTLEAQLQLNNQDRSSPKSVSQIPMEASFIHSASKAPSMISMSEDGNDDARSCADSWATVLMSELSQFKKEKSVEKSSTIDNANHLELMDDFLEMEKLACSTGEANKGISHPDDSIIKESNPSSAVKDDVAATEASSEVETSAVNQESSTEPLPLAELQSRISMIFKSLSKEDDPGKIMEDLKKVVLDACDGLCQPRTDADAETNQQASLEGLSATPESNQMINKDLATAVVQIHDFILFLGKEAMAIHHVSIGYDGLGQKIEEFSATLHKVLSNKASLLNFVVDLSHVLAKASELKFNILGYKGTDSENSADCIDKVALPENKVVQQDSSGEKYQNNSSNISDLTSNSEASDDGNMLPGYEISTTPHKVSWEDYEKIKSEKDEMALDLSKSLENLETMKSQLLATEQVLAEVKSQLASSQKSYSLAETQLKCMAESYRSLEVHTQELETEVNLLRAKTESLSNELQEERSSHQDALAKCKDLHEQLQRNEACSSETDGDLRGKQEKDLAAAAQKLAECQETIFLLGKQLNALNPSAQLITSLNNETSDKGEGAVGYEPTTSGNNVQDFEMSETESLSSANPQRPGAESMDLCNFPYSPSESEANVVRSPMNSKHPKHRPTLSASSTSSSNPTPEKHSRGFSRFFSAKVKNGH